MDQAQSYWGNSAPPAPDFVPLVVPKTPEPLPPQRPADWKPWDQTPEHLAAVAAAQEAFKAWQAQLGHECPIRPLGSQIILACEVRTQSPGGIIIPEAYAERPRFGTVLAVGPGARNAKGKRVALPVQVGDRVAFPQYYATEAKDHKATAWGNVWILDGTYADALIAE